MGCTAIRFDVRPLRLTCVNDAVGMSEEAALRNSPAQFQHSILRKGCAAQLHEIAGRNHFDLPFDLLEERTVLGALMANHLAVGGSHVAEG